MKRSEKILKASKLQFNNGNFFDAINTLEKYLEQLQPELYEKKILKELGNFYYLRGNSQLAEHYLLLALKKYKYKQPVIELLSRLYQKDINHNKMKSLNINHYEHPFIKCLIESDIYRIDKKRDTEIKFRDLNNWHIIETKIGCYEINSLFDTGGSNLTCISPTLFKKLLKENLAQTTTELTAEIDAPVANFNAQFGMLNNIKIGELVISNLPCLIMPFDSLSKSAGEDIDLLLSGVWLNKGNISFDFTDSVAHISFGKVAQKVKSSDSVVNIEFILNNGQRIISQIEINNEKGLALWDSGTPLDFMINPEILNSIFDSSEIITEKVELGNNIIKYTSGELCIKLGGHKFRLLKSIGTNAVEYVSKQDGNKYITLVGSGFKKHLREIRYDFDKQIITLVLKDVITEYKTYT